MRVLSEGDFGVVWCVVLGVFSGGDHGDFRCRMRGIPGKRAV